MEGEDGENFACSLSKKFVNAALKLVPSRQFENPKKRNYEVEIQLPIPVYLTSLIELLGSLKLSKQNGMKRMGFDFVAKRAPDIFKVIAEKFPKALEK